MTSKPRLRVAVDIGGTFTDSVLMSGDATVLATNKTLTTHESPAAGAMTGVKMACDQAGIALSDVSGFVHGTTLATNALIERRGARVAGITTEGFRDILEIAYERRYSQYDINIDKPDLIVPRSRCFTVPERVSVKGDVLIPLDESAINSLVASLQAEKVDAIAICFLHAYVNPKHEQRLRELLLDRMPDLSVSISSEVSPEAREFDRLCTTIANAYIAPLMSKYLAEFGTAFQAEGLTCPVLMMTAGGGMTTLETARRFPIRLVESGPAGGAILAAHVARQCGEGSVLSFDMGGTTAKLCLIDNYQPQTSRQFEVSRAARFIKGSGMPVRIPVVDMIEIGAGGGSIAAVDRLGRLTVGPESAGSEPGPAAFGRGGTYPTVTDSDVALGYIEPARFAEGRLHVDVDAANAVLAEHLGAVLGLDATGSAQGVSDIVDESMASAARMHAVESGKDLGIRTMIAFGGNGPLHATRVARRSGVSRILIPNNPGVGSAVGFLFAPVSFEVVRSFYTLLKTMDVAAINTMFDSLIDEAASVVRAGAPAAPLTYERTAFMRYHGQGHEIEIALPDRALEDGDLTTMQDAFEVNYKRQFARAVPGMDIEILNWSVRVSTKKPNIDTTPERPEKVAAVAVGVRRIICDVSGKVLDAAVFWRPDLTPGTTLAGPALIAEAQTTTLVSADFSATVDAAGNLVLTHMDAEGTQP